MSFSFIPTAITSQPILLTPPKKPPPKVKHTTRPKTRRISNISEENLHVSVLSNVKSGEMEHALKLFDDMKKPQLYLWNIMIRGFAYTELYQEALQFWHRMQIAGVKADNFTFPPLIKSCAELNAQNEGLKVHGKLVKMGLYSDLFVCNSLICMYSKLGLITEAEKVFDEMPERDRVSWNSMIDGYVINGYESKALTYFREFNVFIGQKHDHIGLMSALAACSLNLNSKQGREIHCYVIKHSFEKHIKVVTSILDMYCKCGEMSSADKMFDKMSLRTKVTWNSLIGGYALNKQHERAIICLEKMLEENIEPSSVTMINILTSCAESKNISLGKLIHAYCIKKGLFPHLYLETALNDMYGKCGELKSSQLLFDRMLDKTLISFNTMFAAYLKKEKYKEAIVLFIELLNMNLRPDLYTMSTIVPAYAELASLKHGKHIHSYIVKLGYTNNIIIMNSIVHMYSKSGDIKSAREVFDKMPSKDIITWNTIIMGYGIHGFGEKALELFSCMKNNMVRPNQSTFLSVLTACSVSGLTKDGWIIFKSMQEDYNLEPQVKHYKCMVDLLGRTGDLNEALKFIQNMPLPPSGSIWGSLLTASRNSNNLRLAELAMEKISKLEHDNTGCYVLMCSMYAELDKWDDAARVRELMREKGLRKTDAISLVQLPNNSRNFINNDMSHVESKTINEVSDIFSRKIGEKIDQLANRHSVRLAVAFSIISSAVGRPVLVKKNVRVCDVCHEALKKISMVSKREIVVGDSSIYHHFSQGVCCCGDYW